MKKHAYLFLAAGLIIIFFSGVQRAVCQDESGYGETDATTSRKQPAIDVPPGMELREMGGINMLVPEGIKVRSIGSRLVMEEPEEYAARNIKEMKERISELESQQDQLKAEVDSLKGIISELQKKSD